MKAKNKITKAIAKNYGMLNDLCARNCASVHITIFVEVAGNSVLQRYDDLFCGIRNAANLHDAGLKIEDIMLYINCPECFGITFQSVELRHSDALKLLKTFRTFKDNL